MENLTQDPAQAKVPASPAIPDLTLKEFGARIDVRPSVVMSLIRRRKIRSVGAGLNRRILSQSSRGSAPLTALEVSVDFFGRCQLA
jgi:hypothetical protein